MIWCDVVVGRCPCDSELCHCMLGIDGNGASVSMLEEGGGRTTDGATVLFFLHKNWMAWATEAGL